MNLSSFFEFDALLFRVIALLLAIVVHEAAHAAAARLLGARSAEQREGPPKSPIDPIGFAVVLFGPFGWGRPFEPAAAQSWGRTRRLVFHLAGPAANLVFGAFIWWFTFTVIVLPPQYQSVGWFTALWSGVLEWTYVTNIMIAALHLAPLYPLDGFRIVRDLLPGKASQMWSRYGVYTAFPLLIFLILPAGHSLLNDVYLWITQSVMRLF